MFRMRLLVFFTFLFLFASTEATAYPTEKKAQAPAAVLTALNVKEETARDHKTVVIDVRSLQEYKKGHIPGAINVPAPAIKAQPYRLPKDKATPIIIYGRGEIQEESGSLTVTAVNRALKMGYTNLRIFPGGMPEWIKMRYPVKKGSRP